MGENITVSVCCITYNHAPYIRQCLDGFLMQKTDFKYEVLIHDDASTDGTEEIIREYEAKYPDIIKPLYEKENQWVLGRRGSKTFNYPRAKGKYIALCEGDDYWIDPYKLQKQVDFLEQNKGYGLVRTNFDAFYQKSNRYQKNFLGSRPIKDTFIDYLENAWFAGTCTWLFRSVYIEDIYSFPKFNIGDYPLILNISAQSKIKCLECTTSVYRILENSASHHSSNVARMAPYYDGVFNIRLFFWEKYSCSTELLDKISVNHYKNMVKVALISKDEDLLKYVVNKLFELNYINNSYCFLSLCMSSSFLVNILFFISNFYLDIKKRKK